MPRGLIACRVLGTEVPVLVGRLGSHKACYVKLALCAHIFRVLSTMSVSSSSVDDGVTEEINIGTDSFTIVFFVSPPSLSPMPYFVLKPWPAFLVHPGFATAAGFHVVFSCWCTYATAVGHRAAGGGPCSP